MQRPSAQELLEDDFVREAQLPESLKHRISEHLAHHKPVRSNSVFCLRSSKNWQRTLQHEPSLSPLILVLATLLLGHDSV